jgi:hypothetical protein
VDAANAEFQRYAKIGQDIANDPAIDAILAAVNKVRDGEASATPPFVFVDGSSGVGKTQAAFALRARGQLVHHLLLSKVGDDSQPIYKALRPLSNAFVAQLEKDLDVLRRATDSDPLATATLEVFAAPLASAGFLLALLCGNKEGRRATVLALREAVGSLAADTRRAVVFVLDEVDVKGDNGRLLLARNLLRACRLPVVLMGTNATAANYIAGGSQTRVGDTMWPWAHVFVRLPRVTPRLAASLPSGLEAVRPFVLAEMRRCRPWFSHLLADAFRAALADRAVPATPASLLDTMVDSVAERIYTGKPQLRQLAGLFGQLCMLMPQYTSFAYRKDGISNFVSVHFAHLQGEDPITLFVIGGKLCTSDKCCWVPSCFFPDNAHESILQLALGGTRTRPAFALGSKVLRVVEVFNQLKNPLNTTRVDDSNPQAQALSGDALEAQAATAMVVASRPAGLGGTPALTWVHLCVLELLPSGENPELQLRDGTGGIVPAALANLVVPLLFANTRYPLDLEAVPGVRVGYLTRAENKERADVLVFQLEGGAEGDNERPPAIVAECKNWGDRLPASLVAGIVRRAVSGSDAKNQTDAQRRLVVVFCNQLQASYKTWTSEAPVPAGPAAMRKRKRKRVTANSKKWNAFRKQLPTRRSVNLLRVSRTADAPRQLVVDPLDGDHVPLERAAPGDSLCILFVPVKELSSV